MHVVAVFPIAEIGLHAVHAFKLKGQVVMVIVVFVIVHVGFDLDMMLFKVLQ
jgi:hypothetical protein